MNPSTHRERPIEETTPHRALRRRLHASLAAWWDEWGHSLKVGGAITVLAVVVAKFFHA